MHHSGLLPTFKKVIELLFQDSFVNASLFTAVGFAFHVQVLDNRIGAAEAGYRHASLRLAAHPRGNFCHEVEHACTTPAMARMLHLMI